MTRGITGLGSWMVLMTSGVGRAQTPPAGAAAPVTAFVNVAIVPMDSNRVLPAQTVLVRGDRIVAIGPVGQVAVPAAATRVDGQGKFLMPGLADMHAHLVRPTYLVPDRLLLYVANGVTTIREMMSGATQVAIKRRVARGELLGPRIYTASLLSGAGAGDLDGTPVTDWSVQDMMDALAAVKAGGHDFLKYYGELTDSVKFEALMAAARRLNVRVVGHIVPGPGLATALRTHIASIEHLWGYLEALGLVSPGGGAWPKRDVADTVFWMQPSYRLDTAQVRALAVATRQAGVWNTPTLLAMDWFAAHARDSTQHRLYQRVLTWHEQITKALADAGAGLLLGTDLPDGITSPMYAGFSIHRELELLVEAGLSPYQALETGTRNAAAFFGTLDSTGTVAVGKRADLVLVDGNPLEHIQTLRAPAGVMVGGRWLPRAALDDSLRAMLRDDHPEAIDPEDTPPFLGGQNFEKPARQRKLAELLHDIRGMSVAP